MRVVADRFELVDEIGRGATGSVWVARDLQLDRGVAVKLLHRELLENSAVYAAFEHEAKTAARLQSPNVVRIYDAGVDHGEPFIVMELLRGETLEARIQKHEQRPLPVEVGADIIIDVSRALTVVHQAGIVHRDLKPANIVITPEHRRETVKLLDFGVAALVLGRQSPNGAYRQFFAGTPLYMSPEQFDGREPSAQADLWALGVIAYEVMTGRRPFEAADTRQLREQVMAGVFVQPSAVRPEVGTDLDAFFSRVFDKNAEERFQSAAELASELLRIVSGFDKPPVRLLFIDDEEDTRVLLEDEFRDEIARKEYELSFSTDGADGLEVLRRRPDIDVVFTDLNMPGTDGLSFLRRVPDVNPLVRVVVISAYNDMKNIRAAMNHGAFDFLCKPIEMHELRRTIQKCADHAAGLRRTMRYSEENGIMRVVLGPCVDQLINAVRVADGMEQEHFDATVMFLGFRDAARSQESQPQTISLDRLDACYTAVAQELRGRGAAIQRVIGHACMAVFRGHDHCARAIEAALAVVARLHFGPDRQRPLRAAIGVETGQLVAGSIGSLAIGNLEQVTVGPAVELAAELQVVANSNDILLGPAIHAKVASDYRCIGVEPKATEMHLAGSIARVIGGRRAHASADPRTWTAAQSDLCVRAQGLGMEGNTAQ